MIRIPRRLQNLLLVMGSLIFVAAIVEGYSFYLIRTRGLRWPFEPGLPGEIRNTDDARRIAQSNGPQAELARLLLEKNYRISHERPTPEDLNLHREPPDYLPGVKGSSLWKDSHGVTPDLDEEFELKGLYTRKTKYRAHYRTDHYGRRMTPAGEKKNILFLGCSFTFGQGVNDEETFPYLVGKKTGLRTYNAGIPGASPTMVLKRIREDEFPGPVSDAETTVIFTVIPDHIMRTIGTMALFRSHSTSLTHYPYAYLSGDELIVRDSFAGDPTLRKPFLYAFSRTNFARAFSVDYPVLTKDHYHLIARVFKEMEAGLRRKYPRMKHFVVSFFPAGNLRQQYRDLRDALVRENIRIFDFTFLHAPQFLDHSFSLKYDGHPGPVAYELYSDLLIHEIGKL